MEQNNVITLWSVIYTIPYHTHNGYPLTDEIIEDLASTDKLKLNLTDEQVSELDEFFTDLNEMINGIYEKYGGELSGMNGEEDTDEIIDELKCDGDKPIITVLKNGRCKIDTYIYQTT